MDPPCREITFEEPVTLFYGSGEQQNVQATIDPSQSDVSQLQLDEAPEVGDALGIQEQEVYILPEEDFLEMDDLLGPELTNTDVEKSLDNFQLDEVDGLAEFDFYHDAAMFLNDIGPDDRSTISYQYDNSFEQNVVNQYGYQQNSEPAGPGEVDNQLCLEGADQITNLVYFESAHQVNNQLYSEGANPINNHLYPDIANQISYNYQFQSDDASQANEQERSVLTSSEFDHGSHHDPTSGI